MRMLPSIPRIPRTDPVLQAWRPPTPGFHLHIDVRDRIFIDGVPVDLAKLRERTQATLDVVDSVCISVLFTFETDPAASRVFGEAFNEVFEPAVQLYVLGDVAPANPACSAD